jgi:hypothetical protein
MNKFLYLLLLISIECSRLAAAPATGSYNPEATSAL